MNCASWRSDSSPSSKPNRRKKMIKTESKIKKGKSKNGSSWLGVQKRKRGIDQQ